MDKESPSTKNADVKNVLSSQAYRVSLLSPFVLCSLTTEWRVNKLPPESTMAAARQYYSKTYIFFYEYKS